MTDVFWDHLSRNLDAQREISFTSWAHTDTQRELEQAQALVREHHCLAHYCSDVKVQLGRILSDTSRHGVVTSIANRMAALLRPSRFDLVVAHSDPIYAVAKEIVRTAPRRFSVVRAVSGCDAAGRPTFAGQAREFLGARVVLVVDVINTGDTLERLSEEVEKLGGRVVRILSVIDMERYVGRYRSFITSLVRERSTLFPPCGKPTRSPTGIVFDPDSALQQEASSASSEHDPIRSVIAQDPAFWDAVAQTHSYRSHAIVNGRHISPFVDFASLCRNLRGQRVVINRLISKLGPVNTNNVLIVTPPLRKAPLQLASALLTSWGMGKSIWNPTRIRRAVRHAGRCHVDWPHDIQVTDVICLDVGFGTGTTMRELVDCAVEYQKLHPHVRVVSLAALDRSQGQEARALFEATGVMPRFCFKVPFSVSKSEADCRFCRGRALHVGFAKNLRREESQSIIRSLTQRDRRPPKHLHQPTLFSRAEVDDWSSSMYSLYVLGSCERSGRYDLLCRELSSQSLQERRKVAIAETLDDRALADPSVQRVCEGLAANGVPYALQRAVCLKLASVGNFGWLGRGWVPSHKQLFERDLGTRSDISRSDSSGGHGLEGNWQFLIPIVEVASRAAPDVIRDMILDVDLTLAQVTSDIGRRNLLELRHNAS